MAQLVTATATLQCSFGATPTPLIVLPKGAPASASMLPIATIVDFAPVTNIVPFGICNAPTNPAVIAAKAVGATAPCVPVTVIPWAPGSPTVLVNNFPALNSTSKLTCTWAGIISVTSPGQFTVSVP